MSYKVNICIWLLFRLLLFANGGLGSDGGEGRRAADSKTCAIFFGLGEDWRFTRLQHGGHFAAIHRALEKLGLRTKVTDDFQENQVRVESLVLYLDLQPAVVAPTTNIFVY